MIPSPLMYLSGGLVVVMFFGWLYYSNALENAELDVAKIEVVNLKLDVKVKEQSNALKQLSTVNTNMTKVNNTLVLDIDKLNTLFAKQNKTHSNEVESYRKIIQSFEDNTHTLIGELEIDNCKIKFEEIQDETTDYIGYSINRIGF